ncbi:MAG: 1-deoxy-D-xylulose-5-phosphate reductoisomerase [Chloroflexi bacterium]|nr:1-deoxy-D-xylulose-5-phosphate reductoisomerase [Chloroflexota bacterium]
MKRVVVLGSTGSIGQQTLDVIRANPDDFAVVGLAAGRDARTLAAQIAEFKPQAAYCIDGSAAKYVDGATRIHSGDDGIVQLVEAVAADVTVVGTPGMVGARATMAALECGQDVALANKETLVMAGDLVMRQAAAHGATVLPTDSEHSAIWQCIRGEDQATVRRIILAASGGPFRTASAQELAEVTPEQALQHPTWSMGAKITVDSATLLNKGLEIIEAHWLFGLPYTQIDIVIHPQSIVHALVEFADGAVKAQLSHPDMRLPIQHALSFPDRPPTYWGGLDFARAPVLEFSAPESARFPCLALARQAAETGGTAPTVLCAADEVAVELFLAGKIGFLDISRIISQALESHTSTPVESLDHVLAVAAETRQLLLEATAKLPVSSASAGVRGTGADGLPLARE